MEISNHFDSSHDLVIEFAKYNAQRQAYLDSPDPLYTIEWLERQIIDYTEKLIYTPLPLKVMQDQLQIVIDKAEDSGRTNQQFTFDFLQALEIILSAYAKESHHGDHIAFNDLVEAADRSIDAVEICDNQDIFTHPVYLEQNHALNLIMRDFAQIFYQRADLQYICDEIDEWTVHDDVHPKQAERRRLDPETAFFNQPHGYKGRWTPLDRHGLVVWVATSDPSVAP